MASPARKPPQPATEPVIDADAAWFQQVNSARDGALAAESTLRNNRTAREDYFDREIKRLTATRDAELQSIDVQIAQQVNILGSCDAALGHLMGTASNVVPLKPKADEAPIPEFLRRKTDAA